MKTLNLTYQTSEDLEPVANEMAQKIIEEDAALKRLFSVAKYNSAEKRCTFKVNGEDKKFDWKCLVAGEKVITSLSGAELLEYCSPSPPTKFERLANFVPEWVIDEKLLERVYSLLFEIKKEFLEKAGNPSTLTDDQIYFHIMTNGPVDPFIVRDFNIEAETVMYNVQCNMFYCLEVIR